MAALGGVGALDPDGRRRFTTRVVRLFAYGTLSVVLALYLAEAGLNEGLLLTATGLNIRGVRRRAGGFRYA